MSDQMSLYDAQNRLAHAEDRFNALAQVAGREMPKYMKRAYTVPLTIGIAAVGAAVEAKLGTKGTIANGVMAAVAYGVGMMSGENADLREAMYMFSIGLGSSAASIATYDKVTAMMGGTTAPAPTATAAPV